MVNEDDLVRRRKEAREQIALDEEAERVNRSILNN